ncbi:MAG: glycoside hydrolase family 28 protein, partial [Bacteroidota bacterium]|nr:glycoside hydrolase family 28 protein [Bacteroidota bacterium]
NYPLSLTGVHVSNVVSQDSKYAIYIEGLDNKPVTNINIENCTFNKVQKENFVKGADGVQIKNTTINGKEVQTK